MITIQFVPLHLVHHVWPDVARFLADALEQSGADEYNIDQLKGMVAQGQHELYVAVDETNKVLGAATVCFVNYPNCRKAYVTAIGGRLISNRDTWAQFSGLLKSHGATRVAGAARESIARLWERYGFHQKHIEVEVDL